MLSTRKYRLAKILMVFFITAILSTTGQAQLPEVLQTGELTEQLDYIEERTRIYENFRAIREDMFQKVMSNSLDTVASLKSRIGNLSAELNGQRLELDSLSSLLKDTRDELDLAIKNRDNMILLGLSMNKASYNLILWAVIAGLAFLLVTGFMLLKRTRVVMNRTINETEELKAEFEDYKRTSRETREKLVLEHFNEVRKLKEKLGG